jgi:signal transduction histidine kinase/CheY-like chemotaxis protein
MHEIKDSKKSVDARVFSELINILYRQAKPIFFGNIVVSILSVYLLWHEVEQGKLLAWAAVVFLLTAVRMVIVGRDLRSVHSPDEARRRGYTYAAFSGLSGCLWGSVGILFFAPENAVVTVFTCILLAGMTGGSVASQSSFLPAYYAFSLPTVLPFAVRSFAHGDSLFPVLGLLSLFLLAVNLAYSRNIQSTVREAVSLRFENMELIEQLQLEKERAESASRSKSQFLAAASHDLRQPTHALGLYIATLRSLCAAPVMTAQEVGDIVSKLQSGLKGLVQLLDVLLDISKLDAGAVRIRQEVFDLGELLETLDQQFAAIAAEKGLSLIVRPSSITVKSDRVLLHSMLANFISNALRYTERGKILVGVRRRGEEVEVQVLDTGIGIAEDQLQLIFREFYQILNVARRREHGLGLGLAIVRRTADLLKVRIDVRSVVNRGSLFSVRLPVEHWQPMPPAEIDMPVRVPSSRSLLVIDDDPDVLDSMRLLLTSWGHQVTAVLTPDCAMRAVRERQQKGMPIFDAILSDFRLAENTSGIDLVRSIRQASGMEIPAIVITGDTSVDSLRYIAAAGVRILHKPLDADELRSVLDEPG